MIEVITPGLMSSIQDFGRSHFAHIGVSKGGAIDKISLHLANRLVENPPNTPALEIIQSPAQFRFNQDCWIALTGTTCNATLNDRPVWRGWRMLAKTGDVLKLTPLKKTGFAIYLAIAGGIVVPSVLGSASTDLKSRFGGYQNSGRSLKKGDILTVGEPSMEIKRPLGIKLPRMNHKIKVVAGPEYDSYTLQSQAQFWHTPWLVSSNSNRIGFRLLGSPLEQLHKVEMLSVGVFPGTIQVPPNGLPIILTAEAQSTGGYPRIGMVAQADLWKLGQVQIGSSLHFVQITAERAKLALIKQRNYLHNIEDVIMAAR